MKQKNIFIAASVLLIAAFAVGAFFYKNQQTQQAEKLAAQNQAALVRADSPSFGNADAPVHIVEFFDPACGTCREFYPLVKNLMAAHPGKIRLSMRYAPFHPGSDQVVKVMAGAQARSVPANAGGTVCVPGGVGSKPYRATGSDLVTARQLGPRYGAHQKRHEFTGDCPHH
jgi:protein-disulfide isomerase